MNTPFYMHKKVMVVDDMHLDRFVARHVITRFGFSETVILMESAPKALTYLLSVENMPAELPTVIFLDLQMPDMSGFGFLDQFEQMPENIVRHCNIVMLTSSVDPKDFKKATDRKHVKHYIVKPLDKEKLNELNLMLT